VTKLIEVDSTSRHPPRGNDDKEKESITWCKMAMRMQTRSVIRSTEIARFREELRDLVITGSDSENVSVMDLEGGQAKILHCLAFGKTGADDYMI